MSTEPDAEALAVVNILFDQGQLTADQKRRLLRALESGKPFENAIVTTPLVEPLMVLRARQGLEVAKVEAGASPLTDTQILKGVSRDNINMINVIEFDFEVDDSWQLPTSGTKPTPGKSYGSSDIEFPKDFGAYELATPAPGMFDLANDEGINLIRDLNEILDRAVSARRSALRFSTTWIEEFDTSGACQHKEAVDEDQITKMIARLKIMARIQPWKSQDALGKFHLHSSGFNHTAYVTTSSDESAPQVTLYLKGGKC